MPYLGAAGTPVTDLTGTETFVCDDGGVLKEITAANFGASTPIAEAIRDIIGVALVAGANITVTPDDTANTITIAAPAAGYTDEQVRDVMGAALVAGSNITITPDDTLNTITIAATAVASYTAQNTRTDLAAAATGDPGHLIITPVGTPVTSINWSLDPNFVAQVSALGPGTFIQTNDSVIATASYVTLPGTSGNYVSSPDSAALDITGDIDICARLAPTTWVSGQTFFAHWSSAANGSYRLGLSASGFIQWAFTLDNVTTLFGATSVTPGGTNGVPMWIRATRASATGSCNFYTCPDQETEPTAGQWVTLQLGRPSTAGSLLASTAPANVSGSNAGTASPFAGLIYRIIVKNGIAGTIVVDFNPSSWTSGATWTSATGEVWTLNGTAAVTAGSSTAVSNTTTPFSLGETDAAPSIPLALHDTMFFFSSFGLVNTSGSSVTYTFKVTINGADLFLIPVQTLTSVASSVRNGYLELRVDMNGSSGSSQVASATLVIANATTGTGSGSDTLATEFVRLTGNRAVSTLTTFNSVPQIQLRCTMGTAAATISAQPGFTQLVLGKA